jgi:hypothetical protein
VAPAGSPAYTVVASGSGGFAGEGGSSTTATTPGLNPAASMPTVPDDLVEEALTRLGSRLVIGLPLGLGKPNRLVNTFYRRAKADPRIQLELVTALSLDPPDPSSELERRFVEPFVRRHFGEGYPRLEYVGDLRGRSVPENVRVTEFYLQSGSALGNALSQRHHVSSNYTHVPRDLMDRGVNLILQLAAPDPEGDSGRVSLSCNPDVTLDVVRRLRAGAARQHLVIGQLHPDLPFMHGDAIVEEGFFHHLLPPEPDPQPLFALPRTPVSVQDHWVGLHASTLVADGGTLQIGIGALGDALVHALLLRHQGNAAYRERMGAARGGGGDGDGPGSGGGVSGIGGLDPFRQGLYGASEMFMDGFMHLYRAGILKREVFDDLDRQRAANEGGAEPADGNGGPAGSVMDAAFFLGSRPFYDFLRELPPGERARFRMMSVKRINQLYGETQELEVQQRRRARFFNTCMMTTLTGAAVSDAVADHQVVSGVGGQYNFVAMAHAMEDGRSILMMKSTRERRGRPTSNVVWEYPHTTIPRHLRDVVVTEYGVAFLRGRTDEECIQALIGISDARFQEELSRQAKDEGKLDPDWEIPAAARSNTPERLAAELPGGEGTDPFPRFPFGSDFTPVEERLVEALRRLEGWSGSRRALARAALRGRPQRFPQEMRRMELDRPRGARERFQARLVAAALAG